MVKTYITLHYVNSEHNHYQWLAIAHKLGYGLLYGYGRTLTESLEDICRNSWILK